MYCKMDNAGLDVVSFPDPPPERKGNLENIIHPHTKAFVGLEVWSVKV